MGSFQVVVIESRLMQNAPSLQGVMLLDGICKSCLEYSSNDRIRIR